MLPPSVTHARAPGCCPQYGHPAAHAIEHLSWHGMHKPLLHGEAVAIGMCVTAEVALLLGIGSKAALEQTYRAVLDAGLPAFVPELMGVQDILEQMKCVWFAAYPLFVAR